MTNIVDYVFTTFPTSDHILLEFKKYCLEFKDVDKWNSKDFIQKLSDFLFNEDNTITVFSSSTFAVCQEFLGNLTGSDLSHAQSRGGLWALRTNKTDENEKDDTVNNVEVISVRRVLTDLKKKYIT
jgi:hypothetical protein